jgi:catechol-2,3-dioxygenase
MTQVETETTKLAPETRLGAVELTVTDLDRSVSFY